ncbi:hypothetical protein B484DRAFT_423208 [Ochromonadaceae sp. CCMP2298]|nr:hypothetical protein B484DRAFT_423208 [Ochromonadaceae sp. CCMP2298]
MIIGDLLGRVEWRRSCARRTRGGSTEVRSFGPADSRSVAAEPPGWLPSLGTAQHLLQHRRPSSGPGMGAAWLAADPTCQLASKRAPQPVSAGSSAEAFGATALSPTERGARLRRSRLCVNAFHDLVRARRERRRRSPAADDKGKRGG